VTGYNILLLHGSRYCVNCFGKFTFWVFIEMLSAWLMAIDKVFLGHDGVIAVTLD